MTDRGTGGSGKPPLGDRPGSKRKPPAGKGFGKGAPAKSGGAKRGSTPVKKYTR